MTQKHIKVRKGTAEDLPTVYDLVMELAIYEKEPEAVTATLQDYRKDYADGLFQTIVAESEGEIIGMALYYTAYSTWKGKMMYLEDFVVRQGRRRAGAGQLLYDAFIAESEEKGAKLVKWQVLDWNEPAKAFYVKNGAVLETNWYNVKKFL